MLSTLDDERYRWNGFTREADLFFAVTLGRYPNRRGGLQYVVRGSRAPQL